MSPLIPPAFVLASAVLKLVTRHGQRLWNNLTPEERSEFIYLLSPKDGTPVTTVKIKVPTVRKEEGKRLPRFNRGGEDSKELKVPVPNAAYLKKLTPEEQDRLKALIKKANTGKF